MGRIVIDDLDDATLERLRQRARAHDQSVEQAARDVLCSALAAGRAERLAAIDRIRAMTPKRLETDRKSVV